MRNYLGQRRYDTVSGKALSPANRCTCGPPWQHRGSSCLKSCSSAAARRPPIIELPVLVSLSCALDRTSQPAYLTTAELPRRLFGYEVANHSRRSSNSLYSRSSARRSAVGRGIRVLQAIITCIAGCGSRKGA